MIKCFDWLCDQECSKLSIPFHISLPEGRRMLNGVIYHNCVGQSAGIILKSPGMFDLNLQVSSAQKLRVLYCVTYLVVYTKLDSVDHIFHGGHSHESTGLARSDNSIPRSFNLVLESFVIFRSKNDSTWKGNLQRRKICHSHWPCLQLFELQSTRKSGGHAIIVTEYWGWVKLRSHSTAVKIAKSIEFSFSVSVFTIALGIQKREATVGKETF